MRQYKGWAIQGNFGRFAECIKNGLDRTQCTPVCGRVHRYVAEWIELWDLEAMTSYNREIGVRGPVGAIRLEFFHPGFTPTVFLHQAESVPADLI